MSKHEDLLATIEQLKHENSVLQQTIYELQQEKQNQYPRRRDPRWGYFQEDFPGFVAGGDLTFNCGIAAEDDREDNEELRQKVRELKKKIENLEKKLKDSPLKYVVNAIKDKARYDSPSAAYQLFEKQDYIFKDCEQWKDNVKELKEFLLREKNKAVQNTAGVILLDNHGTVNNNR